jgi:decaprenyl-diphosphate synthase subunit 1
MACAVNHHLLETNGMHPTLELINKQRTIALIGEMYHTASLYHDDVLDKAELRRGKISANTKWNQNVAVLAGDFVMATSVKLLANVGKNDVTGSMLSVLNNLVLGELQQMSQGSKKDKRFNQYLDKTYNKTASLMAQACHSVAILSQDESGSGAGKVIESDYLPKMALNFGRNLGMAFQLVDDYLDFVANQDQLGKPAANDLR